MEKAYWEARYRKGTLSGSICVHWNSAEQICDRVNCLQTGPDGACIIGMGYQRAWKWKIIGEMVRKYIPDLLKSKLQVPSPPHALRAQVGNDRLPNRRGEIQPSSLILPKVIDVGCGDLIFWDEDSLRLIDPRFWRAPETMLTEEYVGIDISDETIMRNRRLNEGHKFIVSSSDVLIPGLTAPVVFCIDLLFHIMDDRAFIDTLRNLCFYSEDLIIIHTWKYNPFSVLASDTDGIYQKYRPFEAYIKIFKELGFTLMEERPNPNRLGCLYIFKLRARYMY